MKFWIYCFISIILFAFAFATFYGMTYQHELVHKDIFSNYGINSSIEMYDPIQAYRLGAVGMTIPEHTNKTCNETCKMLHSQNEIVSYNLDYLIITIFAIFFLYLNVKYLEQLK